jgi:TolA-binding protein
VKYRTVDGRMRITQTWNVDIDNPVFVFRIRDSGERGPDPQEEIVKLSKFGKLGESLALERDEVKKVREAVVRERMETDIRNLEIQERREWVEAQALAFQARISRRAQLAADALKALDAYLKRWAGEGTEGKADTLRRDLEKDLAQTPPAEAERPRRIFDRAKKLAEAGRRALAQSLLQTLVVRYPSSDVAADAQTLLKSLSD